MLKVIKRVVLLGAVLVSHGVLAVEEIKIDFSVCDQYLIKTTGYPEHVKQQTWRELYKARDYHGILSKHKYLLSQDKANRESYRWASEASVNLGEIWANDRDLQDLTGFVFLAETEEGDSIDGDLKHISNTIGPNFWSADFNRDYGNFALCSIRKIREQRPLFHGFYTREIAVMIAMGQLDEAEKSLLAVTKETIKTNQQMGEYLSMFIERYIGYGYPVRGAEYLKTIDEKHGVIDQILERWRAAIERHLQRSNDKRKRQKIARVNELLKNNHKENLKAKEKAKEKEAAKEKETAKAQ